MNILKRAKYLVQKKKGIFITNNLKKFLNEEINMNDYFVSTNYPENAARCRKYEENELNREKKLGKK